MEPENCFLHDHFGSVTGINFFQLVVSPIRLLAERGLRQRDQKWRQVSRFLLHRIFLLPRFLGERFWWWLDMISGLIDRLNDWKSKMEYRSHDFYADEKIQGRGWRSFMLKICPCSDLFCFSNVPPIVLRILALFLVLVRGLHFLYKSKTKFVSVNGPAQSTGLMWRGP